MCKYCVSDTWWNFDKKGLRVCRVSQFEGFHLISFHQNIPMARTNERNKRIPIVQKTFRNSTIGFLPEGEKEHPKVIIGFLGLLFPKTYENLHPETLGI